MHSAARADIRVCPVCFGYVHGVMGEKKGVIGTCLVNAQHWVWHAKSTNNQSINSASQGKFRFHVRFFFYEFVTKINIFPFPCTKFFKKMHENTQIVISPFRTFLRRWTELAYSGTPVQGVPASTSPARISWGGACPAANSQHDSSMTPAWLRHDSGWKFPLCSSFPCLIFTKQNSRNKVPEI